MATQAEPEPSGEAGTETVKVENNHITRLMEENTLAILQNVNTPSLKRYLIQYRCIGLPEEERLNKGSQHDNNLELMKIISARGAGAFEGFLRALEHSVRDDPGQEGHRELCETLRRAYGGLKRKLSRSMSRTLSSSSVSPLSSLQITSIDSRVRLEGIIASAPDPALEKDVVVQQRSRAADGQQEVTESSTATGSPLIPETAERPLPQTTSQYIIWTLGSIGTLFVSLLLFIWGITLLVFSGQEFHGKRDCKGVGDRYTLSTFNFFFGLLCLSVPGLLIMFMLYFHFEKSEGECKQKIKRLLVWLTIIFFLICFILTIGELLYSLLYVIQEVYTHYPAWRDNKTLCDGVIYISSFSNIILSYSILFLVLVGLGVISAVRYFLWITDPHNPGALRKLLAFEYIAFRRS